MKAILLILVLALSGCASMPNTPTSTHHAATASLSPATTTSSTATATSSTTSHPSSSSSTTTSSPTTNHSGGTNQTALPAKPRDWGSFAGKTIRPGIGIDNNNCTTNFLFQENWTRFFLGTAAHCIGSTDFCHAPENVVGAKHTLMLRGGGSTTVTVAYSSAFAMTSLHETDSDACTNNDLAVLELTAADLEKAHPAVLYFGGPTALDNHTLKQGDDVYFWGHSSLREASYPAVEPPVYLEESSPNHLKFRYYTFNGWNFDWNGLVINASSGNFTQDPQELNDAIPGDSGGPFLGPHGAALAKLGGGAESLEYSLQWMQAHWPWHVELVTWSQFSPTGIEPLHNGPCIPNC